MDCKKRKSMKENLPRLPLPTTPPSYPTPPTPLNRALERGPPTMGCEKAELASKRSAVVVIDNILNIF